MLTSNSISLVDIYFNEILLQDPTLDSYMLEHEARKLDSTLAHSLPPLNDSYDSSK